MQTLWQDLRYGVRMLMKAPDFTLIAVITLALGIGANTAIFSVIDAVLLKRLPVKDPEQLVLLNHTGRYEDNESFMYGSYERFRDYDRTLSGLLAYHPLRLTVSVAGQPEAAVNGQLVSGNYYQVLGVSAALGRTLAPEDDRAPGAHPVCVISDGYWQRRFGRDPGIIGQTIQFSGFPFTVIGVTPPDFFGLEFGSPMDVSVPVAMREQVTVGYIGFRVLGRLRPGATREQAQASLGLLYRQQKLEGDLVVASGSRGLSDLRQRFSQPLFILMSVVALVLLIACANVAGLLLARAVARRKEMALRLALGAGRLRLVRQLLVESLLLASLGGLLGLLFAWWGTPLFLPLLSREGISVQLSFSLDLRLLGFTATVAVLTSVLFGLAPAFLATRVDLQSALKQHTSGMSGRAARFGFGQFFVIAQVALSLLLLVGAGLFVRSLQKLQQVETGFARDNVLVLKLEPLGGDKNRFRPRLTAFYDELLRRVAALPGVVQVSLVGYSPISRIDWHKLSQDPEGTPIYVEGHTPRPDEGMRISWMQVYPNSFATLGLPLLVGRDFNSQDNHESPAVAVINESMARHFFGSANPVGRHFGFAFPARKDAIEIVGVVKDAKYRSLREPGRPLFYLPFAQAPTGRGQMTLIVRTAGAPAPVAAALWREARALDATMPMFEVGALAAQLDVALAGERLLARLSSVFGLLALALACIGLYGVLAYDVAQHTQEIGVRMALGAQRGDVLRLVVKQGISLALVGVGIGLLASFGLTRLVSGLLFGVSATDPLTFITIAMLLMFVAALACWIPARRATKVDPMIALRCE